MHLVMISYPGPKALEGRVLHDNVTWCDMGYFGPTGRSVILFGSLAFGLQTCVPLPVSAQTWHFCFDCPCISDLGIIWW